MNPEEQQSELAGLKSKVTELESRNQWLSMLYSIALDLLNHRTVGDVLSKILLSASELLDAPHGLLDVIEGEMLHIKYATKEAEALVGMRIPIENAALSARAIQTLQPQFVNNYSEWADRVKIHDPYQLRAACTFPILISNIPVGVISLGRYAAGKPFTAEDEALIFSFADLASIALENANLFEETRKKSVTDALTGLANRREFDSTLEEEWKRAKRIRKPLALFLLDIDSFKKYNDAYGHTQGDECLKQIAKVLEKSARRTFDMPARYGGEELALILPGVNLTNARRMAEEIRVKIEELRIPHDTSEISPWVTVSIGVATIVPKQEDTSINLVTLADKALYKAKREGKNRVFFNPTDDDES